MSHTAEAVHDARDEAPRGRGRVALVALFALFFAPIALSLLLNLVRPDWLPFGTMNRGALLAPAFELPLDDVRHAGGELPPQSALEGPLRGHWTWALWGASCTARCDDMLEAIARARVTLGKNNHRVQPALVQPTDVAPLPEGLPERLPRLQLDAGTGARLDAAIADVLADDGLDAGDTRLLLVDPRGFVVVAYAADSDASHWLKDVARLLRISKLDAQE